MTLEEIEKRSELLCKEAYDRFVMGGWEATDLFGFANHLFRETASDAAATECAACQTILNGIADLLHNQTTDRTAAQVLKEKQILYGLVEEEEQRAAAKCLRAICTHLRVRELRFMEGKL